MEVTKNKKRNRLIWATASVVFVTILGVFCLLSTFARAAFNPQINYQGKLTTHSNVVADDGAYAMEFKLYSGLTGGSALWTETRTGANKVTLTNGLFSVMLGEINALPTSTSFFNQALYLEVSIGTTTPAVLSPRKKLGAVPAALYANDAGTVGGVASSSLLRSDLDNAQATITNLTSTNLFAQNASLTRATTTNFFASVLNAFSAFFTNLTATIATITNLTATNSTTTNATTTNLFASTLNAVTGIFTNLVGTNVTSTNLVSIGNTTLATTTATRLSVGTTSQVAMFNIQGASGVSALNITSSTGASMLTVLVNGNIGIGTSSPTNRLEVSGNTYLGGNLTVTGSGTFTGALSGSNLKQIQYSFAVPSAAGDAVGFAMVTNTNFSSNVEIWLTIHSSGYAQSKRYIVPVQYNGTNGVWQKALPISTTGIYSGNDAEIDVMISNQIASFRLRRTAGSTAGTASITLAIGGDPSGTTVTPTSTAFAAPSVTANYAPTSLTMRNGKTGINNDAPTAYLDILGTTEQLRVGYDTSNYLSATIGSTGLATFTTVGAAPSFAFLGGNVGVGTSTPNATLNIFGSSTATTLLRVATSTNQNIFVIGADGNASMTGDLNMIGLTGNIITTSSIKVAIQDLDTRLYNQQNTTKEMTGFPNRTDTSIGFVDGTRTLTITGTNFKVYSAGKEYIKNTQSIVIPNTTGLYFIYYDKTTGALSTSTNFWTLTDGTIPVATVYWSASIQKGLLAEERHGLTMDGETHAYLHSTVGTRYQSGLTGTFDSNRATTTAGVIWDEDISLSLPQQTQFQVFYKIGGEWQFTAAQNQYYNVQASSLLYNNAGTATTTAGNSNYVAYWILATDNSATPVISVMGQRVDTSIANARANNLYESLSFGTLPFSEMKVLYRVILRQVGGAAQYIETQDLRSVSNLPSGTYVASAHGALTGLLNDDHTQYALLAGRDAGQSIFGGNASGTNLIIQGNSIDYGLVALQPNGGAVSIGSTTNITAGSYVFNVASTTGANYLTVLNSGNIGIGTTSPSNALEVNGSGYFTGNLGGANITATGILTAGSYKIGSATVLQGSTNVYVGSSGTSGSVTLQTTSGNLTLLGGNVGIGTTTPLSRLTVQATSGISALNIVSSTGASMLTVASNGNVGIGTSSPSYKFTVDGDTSVFGTLTVVSTTYIGDAGTGVSFEKRYFAESTMATSLPVMLMKFNSSAANATFPVGSMVGALSNGLYIAEPHTGNDRFPDLRFVGDDYAYGGDSSYVAGVEFNTTTRSLTFDAYNGYTFGISNSTSSNAFIINSSATTTGDFVASGNLTTGGTLKVGSLNGLLFSTNGVVTAISTSSLVIAETDPDWNLASSSYFKLDGDNNATGANVFVATTTFGAGISTLTISQVLLDGGAISIQELFGQTNAAVDIFSIRNGLLVRGADNDPAMIFSDAVAGNTATISYVTSTSIFDFSEEIQTPTGGSSEWSSTYNLVTASSSSWTSAYNIVVASSSNWDTAYTWGNWKTGLSATAPITYNSSTGVIGWVNPGYLLNYNSSTALAVFSSVSSTNISSTNLTVSGSTYLTGLANTFLAVDGAGKIIATSSASSASQWTTTGTSIYFNTGRVGVATTSLLYGLTVATTSLMRDILPETNLSYNLGSSASRWDNLWVKTLNVGTSTWSIGPTSNGSLAIYDSPLQGGNVRLFIASSTGNVGIGTTTPGYGLTVASTTYFGATSTFASYVTIPRGNIAASAINIQSAATTSSFVDADQLLVYSASAGVNKNISKANFVAGVGASISLKDLADTEISKQATTNIVDDNFESGSFLNWDANHAYCGAHYATSTTFNHTAGGSKTLKAGSSNNGVCDGYYIKPGINIVGGVTYHVSIWVYPVTFGASSMSFSVFKVTVGGVDYSLIPQVATTSLTFNTWNNIQGDFTPATSDANATFTFVHQSVMNLYFDDVTIGGQTYPLGTLLAFDGSNWVNTSTINMITSQTTNNSIFDMLTMNYRTTQTYGVNGLGVGSKILAVNSTGTDKTILYQKAEYTDVTNASEDSKVTWQTLLGGVLVDNLVLNAGNVGIGTSTPSQKLDVLGNIRINATSSYMLGDIKIAYGSTTLGNYFFGGAGNDSMTGMYNTAVGYQALSVNTSGYYNTASGYRALASSTANYNTASGYGALSSNTTGESNVAFGFNALALTVGGGGNTAIGADALFSNISGAGNVAIGKYAGMYELGSESFYVNNQDRTDIAGDRSGSLLYGTFSPTPASQTLTINASTTIAQNLSVLGVGNSYFTGNVGIGTTTPIEKLIVDNGSINSFNSFNDDYWDGSATTTYTHSSIFKTNYAYNNPNSRFSVGVYGYATSTDYTQNGNYGSAGVFGESSLVGVGGQGQIGGFFMGTGPGGMGGYFGGERADIFTIGNGYYGAIISGQYLASLITGGDGDGLRVDSSATVQNAFCSTPDYTNQIDCENNSYVWREAGSPAYAIHSTGGLNYFEGNVGIGTTTPSSALQVVGTSTLATTTMSFGSTIGNLGGSYMTVENKSVTGLLGSVNLPLIRFKSDFPGDSSIGGIDSSLIIVEGSSYNPSLQFAAADYMDTLNIGKIIYDTANRSMVVTDVTGNGSAYPVNLVIPNGSLSVVGSSTSPIATFSDDLGNTLQVNNITLGLTLEGHTTALGPAMSAVGVKDGLFIVNSSADSIYEALGSPNTVGMSFSSQDMATSGDILFEDQLGLIKLRSNYIELDSTNGVKLTDLTNGAVCSLDGVLSNTCPSSMDYKHDIASTTLNVGALLGLQVKTFVWNNNSQADFGLIAEEVKSALPELYQDDGRTKGYRADHLPFYLLQIAQNQNTEIKELTSRLNSVSTSTASNDATITVNNANNNFSTLSVSTAVTFYGTMMVFGEAGFESKVTFKNDVEIQGKLYLDQDQLGTVMIPAGTTTIEVMFAKPYNSVPKVLLNLNLSTSSIFARYAVTKKSSSSFWIIIDAPVADDLYFDWVALGLREGITDYTASSTDNAFENLINIPIDGSASSDTDGTEAAGTSTEVVSETGATTTTPTSTPVTPEVSTPEIPTAPVVTPEVPATTPETPAAPAETPPPTAPETESSPVTP